MPDFSVRHHLPEMMDDLSITDERLHHALQDLTHVNRWLGGYGATMSALGPWLRARRGPVRILDLGTGAADFPAYLVRWAARRDLEVEVVGVDVNPATVQYARQRIERSLEASLRASLRVEAGDARSLPYEDDSFDVVVAALVLHHMEGDALVRVLGEMTRIGRHGLIVNDLHRHAAAYYGIRLVTALLPVSPMVRCDGPRSVLRGFRREELATLADRAGLPSYRLYWRWAFRWVLTTLRTEDRTP